MSQNLYAKPYVPREGVCLGDSLKYILRKNHDLSCINPDLFTVEDLKYLTGLQDGGVEGVKELIDMILKYEKVEVWQE